MWGEGPSWLNVAGTSSTPPLPQTTSIMTTPPDRRLSYSANDSGLGNSFCSPPLTARFNMNRLASPLRTPCQRTFLKTPSPFRFSGFSPTLSDRALKLSNGSNVLDVKFCEDSMKKDHGRLDICRLATPAARSLDLQPPPPEACSQTSLQDSCTTTSSLFSSSLSAVDLDCTIPMYGQFIDTPSKYWMVPEQDSAFFEDSMNSFSTSPLKRLNFDQNEPSCLAQSPDFNKKESPKTPGSFKKAMADVQQRQGVLQPKQLLNEIPDQQSIYNPYDVYLDVKPYSDQVQESGNNENYAPPAKKKKRESEQPEIFRTPKKPLKPFSRRWLRIVTGSTRAQRDMTLAAHAFLAQRSALTGTSTSSSW